MIHITVNLPDGKGWEGNQLPGTSLDEIFEGVQAQHPTWTSVVLVIAKGRQ
jgi:hypothetical protein